MSSKFAELESRLQELRDLRSIMEILGWDQEVCLPPESAGARSAQMGTLSKISHEMLVADETGVLLEAAKKELNGVPFDSYEASLLRVTEREFKRQTRVPSKLVARFSEVTSLAQPEWVKARSENRFDLFRDRLAEIFDLTQEIAVHIGYEDEPYDAMLAEYEPGLKAVEVADILQSLQKELTPVVKGIAAKAEVDRSILFHSFPIEDQERFGREVATKIGFNFDYGRLDTVTHPFCTGFHPEDVRITTRYNEKDFTISLFGIMHEAGHGIYEQGFGKQLARTLLSDGASMGIHESQSRLWENQLGRSREFWHYFYPKLQQYQPHFNAVSLDDFYKAINYVAPSLIRVDADEVTYNLHILLRFELERAMLNNEITVDQLPQLWRDKMEAYLGIVPETDSVGVLQDVHWSFGLIGYFPSYSIGNLVSAQLYEKMLEEHPDFPAEVAEGEFSTLINWMGERIHQHGRIYSPQQLVKNVTGEPIQSRSYMNYIWKKFSSIYEL